MRYFGLFPSHGRLSRSIKYGVSPTGFSSWRPWFDFSFFRGLRYTRRRLSCGLSRTQFQSMSRMPCLRAYANCFGYGASVFVFLRRFFVRLTASACMFFNNRDCSSLFLYGDVGLHFRFPPISPSIGDFSVFVFVTPHQTLSPDVFRAHNPFTATCYVYIRSFLEAPHTEGLFVRL